MRGEGVLGLGRLERRRFIGLRPPSSVLFFFLFLFLGRGKMVHFKERDKSHNER